MAPEIGPSGYDVGICFSKHRCRRWISAVSGTTQWVVTAASESFQTRRTLFFLRILQDSAKSLARARAEVKANPYPHGQEGWAAGSGVTSVPKFR